MRRSLTTALYYALNTALVVFMCPIIGFAVHLSWLLFRFGWDMIEVKP